MAQTLTKIYDFVQEYRQWIDFTLICAISYYVGAFLGIANSKRTENDDL